MSKARIKTADAPNNSYTIDVSGYGTVPAQCVTVDELVAGSEVNIIDQYNIPPDESLSFGNIRVLPNSGEYTYSSDKVWKTADELWAVDAKGALAKAFFFSCEENPRWQDKFPLYNIGTVTGIIDEKYMWVMCRNDVQRKCRTDYMTCDTAAFSVDDQVAVKFENCDKDQPVVVGFWNEPQPCRFKFKLTRGDGEIVNEELDGYFDLYNSKEEWISSMEFTYDEKSEYWTLIFDKEDRDKDGYFVFYDCDDGLETQYPFKYKDDDQFQEADLIQPATYEDDVPYWNTTEQEGDDKDFPSAEWPYDDDYGWNDTLSCPAGWGTIKIRGHIRSGNYTLIDGSIATIKYSALTIRSSIPYRVRYQGESKTAFPTGFGWLFYANGEDFTDPCSYKLITSDGAERVIETGGTGMHEVVEHEGIIGGKQHFITLEPIHKAGFKHTAIRNTVAYITIDYDY